MFRATLPVRGANMWKSTPKRAPKVVAKKPQVQVQAQQYTGVAQPSIWSDGVTAVRVPGQRSLACRRRPDPRKHNPYRYKKHRGKSASPGVFAAVSQQVRGFTQAFPQATSGISIGMRYLLGDLFVQKVIEGKDEADVRRTGGFAIFGLLYGGLPGHYIYCLAYPALAAMMKRSLNAGKWTTAVSVAFIDICGNNTLLYFPLYYCTQGVVANATSSDERSAMTLPGIKHEVETRLAKYYIHGGWIPDIQSALAVWVPLHAFNFRFVPVHYRMPFMSAAGGLWVVVLSMRSGAGFSEDSGGPEAEGPEFTIGTPAATQGV